MSDDDDIAVAEYALGTLPSDERARLALRLAGDPTLRATLRVWQARLAPLDAGTRPEAPPMELWSAILAALPRRTDDIGGLAAAGIPAPADSNVVDLRRRLAWWRGGAIGAAALAAGLAGLVVVDRSAVAPAASGRYVAVVDTGGHEPALIAEVDTATGLIRVRAVAAQVPAGHSLELWHIANGKAPRSLGVLTQGPDAQMIDDAVSRGSVDGIIAVTVEEEGGSPSGNPTGAPVYSGRLVAVD